MMWTVLGRGVSLTPHHETCTRVHEAKALIQQWLLPSQPKRIAMYCRYRNHDPRKMSSIRNLGKSPTLRGGNVNKTYCSLVWLVPQSHCTIQEIGKRTQKETWHPAISELEITLFQLREYHCSNTGGKWKAFWTLGFWKKAHETLFFQTINSSRQRVLGKSKYGLRSQEATGWQLLKTLHAQAAGGKAEELPGRCDRHSEDHNLLAQVSGRMGRRKEGTRIRATEWLESQF